MLGTREEVLACLRLQCAWRRRVFTRQMCLMAKRNKLQQAPPPPGDATAATDATTTAVATFFATPCSVLAQALEEIERELFRLGPQHTAPAVTLPPTRAAGPGNGGGGGGGGGGDEEDGRARGGNKISEVDKITVFELRLKFEVRDAPEEC